MVSDKVVLAFSPHADDISIYCGGTLARMVKEGHTLVAVRITDDYTDSIGFSKRETIIRNRIECEQAYKILGAAEVLHLDYASDSMARISETKLREKMVYLIRKYRPFSLIGFDPDAAGEENLDHVVSAWAMAEASWTCAFDKHYPSHLRKGLMPAFVAERLLYSRYATNANCVVDISESIDIKIRALQAQKTMMAHIFYQYEKMAELCSLRLPYDHRVSIDDKVSLFFRSTAEKEGLAHKYRYAESMRRVFAGGPVQSLGATND